MYRKTVVASLGVAALLTIFFLMNIDNSLNQTDIQTNDISFTASDGYALAGSFWPSEEKNAPALILVHQFKSSRVDYRNLVPVLLGEGYSVLSYDTRGFGQSKNGEVEINDFPKDIEGAIIYIQKRDDVEPAAYGVIGASIGGNQAFIASGSIPEISASVALSPADTGKDEFLMDGDVDNFNPKNIFIASDEKEKSTADIFFLKSNNPKIQKVYPGFGHGIGLLRSNIAVRDILKFLEERFE